MNRKTIPFSIVDVFTTTRFCGNPVAVIRDGEDLSDHEMRSIAREFGFSETTFILAPNSSANTARVRIFTPAVEIPFAGHPNIGTAFVIATEETVAGPISTDEMTFDELGGQVEVELVRDNEVVSGARITAPQSLRRLGECDPDTIANCLGLSIDKLSVVRIGPCVATIGLPFAFVELANLSALQEIETNISGFKTAKAIGPKTVDGFSICAFVVLTRSDNVFAVRARVLCPLGHPPEDPATGSAAGALASLLARADNGGSEYRVNIEQGVEMGRPSQIEVIVPATKQNAKIAGSCTSVAAGVIHL